MEIRLMTYLTSDEAQLRVSATTAAPGWPHVGECTVADTLRSRFGDGIRMVKQCNGGRVSAAGEAM